MNEYTNGAPHTPDALLAAFDAHDGLDERTRAALSALRAATPALAGGDIGPQWLPLWEWMTAAGLAVADLWRVVAWVAAGDLAAFQVGGQVYLPRPLWSRGLPGYMSVRRYAARQGLSDSRIYRLISEGRVRPVWAEPVNRYRHYLVAEWAEIEEAA